MSGLSARSWIVWLRDILPDMLVYRIVHRVYSSNLLASGVAGRWNREGSKVIYASESIPLALLENFFRRQGVGFNRDFKIMFLEVPEPFSLKTVNMYDLGSAWRDPYDYSGCQPVGDHWFRMLQSLVLQVPSAVMPEAYNYVINTLHPEFNRVKILAVTDLVPDPRIEEILKNYSKKA
ncbi:RES family NAD+ phosphorylase [Dyadobacter sp. CY343]|uniref:RES family NAD+ phosphorylase n=1 Tax=Dyadobacter sp. CY343 TaxID=2907299 RepID=UPI001F32C35D|nr:RES family NAD+ phosphorylase [Dyadobacter sp. CY343]MCE7059536.1 RES family NAD+ phosphorylase [Dyadobacter sp. CY343]